MLTDISSIEREREKKRIGKYAYRHKLDRERTKNDQKKWDTLDHLEKYCLRKAIHVQLKTQERKMYRGTKR